MKITEHSKIKLFKFESSPHPDTRNIFLLKRVDTRETLMADKNLHALVTFFQKGKTLQEASDALNFSISSIQTMIKILRQAHFIESINGEKLDNETKSKAEEETTITIHTKLKITGQSHLEFYKLHINPHPDEHSLYEVVRVDTEDTLEADKNLVDLIKHIKEGKSVEEAANAINFTVHIVFIMVKFLQDAGFIKRIDGVLIPPPIKKYYENIKITQESRIEFFRLRISQTPDEHGLFGIVRWDTDDTLRVDRNVIILMEALDKGRKVKEAAKEVNFSVHVAMMVLRMYEDAHFIKSIDGELLLDSGKKIHPWLRNIDRRWFQWIIYKPLLYLLLAFCVSGLILGIYTYGIPSYEEFFWTPDLFTVAITFLLINSFLLFIHELAHFCVTKAVGGEAVMRLNYRYIYIVAETESYHLGIVPKKKRYLVYLSGMFVDTFIIGLTYWSMYIFSSLGINLGIMHDFLIAVILSQFLAIGWQFNVFIETDMYNFISDYLGIEHLRNDALKYINLFTKKWNKILLIPIKKILLYFANDISDSSDDLRLLNKSERKKIYLYVLILIIGMSITTLQFIFYSIPADYTFISEAINSIAASMQNWDVIEILKSLTIIIIILFDYILLLILKGNEYARFRNRRRRL